MRKKWASAVVLLLLIGAVGWIDVFVKPTMLAAQAAQEEARLAAEKQKIEETPHAEGVFSSHLPIITIETNGQDIEKEMPIWGTMQVFDQNKAFNYLDDTPRYAVPISIKYRGNSSYLTFDKKQYRIETYKKAQTDGKDSIPLLG
ncbi:MAG: hypothetical protein RR709_08560, partial [Ruthenibacterium sp.]